MRPSDNMQPTVKRIEHHRVWRSLVNKRESCHFQMAFNNKLLTISCLNFGPFLLTDLV
ncbi:hypothetical protein GJAV_G00138480 [Gymnothorax javanicus]|nr:hypothetical protein GJAV_G00138480 [Gymnothorax javanicus]